MAAAEPTLRAAVVAAAAAILLVVAGSGPAPAAAARNGSQDGAGIGRLGDGRDGSRRRLVVYGSDGRTEEGFENPEWASWGAATVALVPQSRLAPATPGGPYIYDRTTDLVSRFQYCQDQRFADQVSLADCSGFLVAPDLVATAGHCLHAANNCTLHPSADPFLIVFGFAITSTDLLEADGSVGTIAAVNVYACAEVVQRVSDTNGQSPRMPIDYAIIRWAAIAAAASALLQIYPVFWTLPWPRADSHAYLCGLPTITARRLDRAVSGIDPLIIDGGPKVAPNAAVVAIGYPLGLPRKYSLGAVLGSGSTPAECQLPEFFCASLDTFAGNSGSPVLATATGRVSGINIAGATDSQQVALPPGVTNGAGGGKLPATPVPAAEWTPACTGEVEVAAALLLPFLAGACKSDADCNDHGACEADGMCTCVGNWTGADCSFLCSPAVCNGHGECVGPHRCTCREGWSGDLCSLPQSGGGGVPCAAHAECPVFQFCAATAGTLQLAGVAPRALVGRVCKVFWPVDNAWYRGLVAEYLPALGKYKVEYKDGGEEVLVLEEERVKVQLRPGERTSDFLAIGREGGPLLETMAAATVKSTDAQAAPLARAIGSRGLKRRADAEDLLAVAAMLGGEGDPGGLDHGDVAWGKIKGFPWWPCLVLDGQCAEALGMGAADEDDGEGGPGGSAASSVAVQFFGGFEYSWLGQRDVEGFIPGVRQKLHRKCTKPAFLQGMQELERYLKFRKLPGPMRTSLEASIHDGYFSAVHEKTDKDAVAALEGRDATAQGGSSGSGQGSGLEADEANMPLPDMPLHLGPLTVLSLGEVVTDSEHFRSDSHIWPVGYKAVRKFPSMKDPQRLVEYQMEILRVPPSAPAPLFRVTPEDAKPVEARSAGACWTHISAQVFEAKAMANILQGLRHGFKSGPHMFGYSLPNVALAIRSLPKARDILRTNSWSSDRTGGAVQSAPPVMQEYAWQHGERCSVCYQIEPNHWALVGLQEYDENQLLQCDKCRTMVHMDCYGIEKPPDGTLWLCVLCSPNAPPAIPPCCLCPVKGGAMKRSLDGQWAHLSCAMWIPETFVVKGGRIGNVEGIHKERWSLLCFICKVPYGACIQCCERRCRVAYHPLCARYAGLQMEVREYQKSGQARKMNGAQISEADGVVMLSYCRKHGSRCRDEGARAEERPLTAPVEGPASSLSSSRASCARLEPFDVAARRGRREPEAVAAALSKRSFVQNVPYLVGGRLAPSLERHAGDPEQLRREPEDSARACEGGSPPTAAARSSPEGSTELLSANMGRRSFPAEDQKGSQVCTDQSTHREGCERHPLSMSERYRQMRASFHWRLTFGKSAIHGWGLFTKRKHKAGDMMIEYAGEIVRPIIADIRERSCYDSLVGAGTYMFRIDNERVVDATKTGSMAHLINHACEPNCYSRVVNALHHDRIVIFAKRDLEAGVELTYDYRQLADDNHDTYGALSLKIIYELLCKLLARRSTNLKLLRSNLLEVKFNSRDERLTCNCGCANCRGFVNIMDEDDDDNPRLLVRRSQLKPAQPQRASSPAVSWPAPCPDR
eukprot:SM000116S24243  [mRNA]  locus=s116:270917:285065:- [translate_table: standard]